MFDIVFLFFVFLFFFLLVVISAKDFYFSFMVISLSHPVSAYTQTNRFLYLFFNFYLFLLFFLISCIMESGDMWMRCGWLRSVISLSLSRLSYRNLQSRILYSPSSLKKNVIIFFSGVSRDEMDPIIKRKYFIFFFFLNSHFKNEFINK